MSRPRAINLVWAKARARRANVLRLEVVVFAAALIACTSSAGAATGDVSTCDLVGKIARDAGLPPGFFMRLIWRESGFRSDAVSPAGAQGVAQFMPLTASERGLHDPFRAGEALAASAAYLRELRALFGNLGLAAAAYNAGPGRVARWRAGTAPDLPAETRAYVRAVTGRDVDTWKGAADVVLPGEADFSCAGFVTRAMTPSILATPADGPTKGKSWAVILVGNPRRDTALDAYRIVRGRYAAILAPWPPAVVHRRISGLQVARYIVQIEHETRAAADGLCGQLRRAGGNCFVLANR